MATPCPACQADNPVGTRFCAECGLALTEQCRRCAAELPRSAHFCPNCGLLLAQPDAREERKVVTVLFADIVDSTRLADRLDPERLRRLLQTYFSEMSAVIEEWGGVVEKFIGDAIMAAFGVPAVREDDAERAVRAGLEMLERLEHMNAGLRELHGVALTVRIGLNTGEVVAQVGPAPDQRIVSGDTVSVAARLEQVAEPATILVGDRTYKAVQHAFRFGAGVQLDLKGKVGQVRAWRVLEPIAERPQRPTGLEAPMVGRDRELRALVGLLETAVESQRPHLAILYGPAGVGKSRLVREFVNLASAASPKPEVLQGRCLAVGHGITYWALAEILRQACGISLNDPADLAQAKCRNRIQELLTAHMSDADIEQTIFALATTAGISLPGNPLDALRPHLVAHEVARAWPRFATGIAGRGTAIFVIEDLHWAGDQLLEMLDRLVTRSSGPLLVLATARPEFAKVHPGFAAGREDVSSLAVAPLTEVQSSALIDGLLDASQLPLSLRREILDRAEGNPFFVEEILQRLMDEGVLIRAGDGWRVTPAAGTITLPDTVHALLAARIDALPDGEKRTLQEASVIGRVFWEQPVTRALGNGAVSEALLNLERKGLLFAKAVSSLEGQLEFMFKHALVRDVAYASLPKARRARAHADIGAWLEELAGDHAEEFVELVAYHYGTAVSGEGADLAWGDEPEGREAIRSKAFRALHAAGAAARKRYAVSKALELHEQAAFLALTDREQAEAFEALGDDHDAAFQSDEAVSAWEAALAIMRRDRAQAGNRARVCVKAAQMGAYRWGGFRVPPAPEIVEAFVNEGLHAAAEPQAQGWLLALRGLCAQRWAASGKPDPVPLEERMRSTEKAWDVAMKLELSDLKTVTARAFTGIYLLQGKFSLVIDIARREVAMAERVPSRRERALTLMEGGLTLMDVGGRYEEALVYAQESYRLAKDMTPHERMHATYAVMNALYHLGRWTELLPALEEHITVFQENPGMSCPFVRGGPLIGAMALSHRGDAEEARRAAAVIAPSQVWPGLAEALLARFAVASGSPRAGREMAQGILSRRRGPTIEEAPFEVLAMVESLVALEEWAALEEFLPRAHRVFGAIALLEPTCNRAVGLVRAAAGDVLAATAALGRARDGFERLHVPFEVARTKEHLAGLVTDDRARFLLGQALATYEDLGASPHAERVRAVLAAW